MLSPAPAAKADRLKQAKDQAEREISGFKAEREAEFRSKVLGAGVGGAVGAVRRVPVLPRCCRPCRRCLGSAAPLMVPAGVLLASHLKPRPPARPQVSDHSSSSDANVTRLADESQRAVAGIQHSVQTKKKEVGSGAAAAAAAAGGSEDRLGRSGVQVQAATRPRVALQAAPAPVRSHPGLLPLQVLDMLLHHVTTVKLGA